jgi:toxin ParE1/3/4
VPLRIVWSPSARKRQEIYEYVARDKPIAAERLTIRIIATVQALRTHPYVGRIGRDPETRELVIGRTPYIVAYKVLESEVRILMIWHGAQERV